MAWSQRTPDWYYGPWIEEYAIWEESSFPWIIENDMADWGQRTGVVTADWAPSTNTPTADWTERTPQI